MLTLLAAILLHSTALADPAGARVLEHRLEVESLGSVSSRHETWRVRVDDPGKLPPFLPAPRGLEGVRSGGVTIRGGRLVLPRTVRAGTVFTFETPVADRRIAQAALSGEFETTTALPVDSAEVVIRARGGRPLTVWADPLAQTGFLRGSESVARLVWRDLPEGETGQAVWSTWQSWSAAGTELMRGVDKMLAAPPQLGRDLDAATWGSTVQAASDRVHEVLTRKPGWADWADARPAEQTIRSGHGRAVDIGVVLLSLLRAGGHDAYPAYYRPLANGHQLPAGVPAPALLTSPAIAIRTAKGTVWLDPALPHVRPPELPATLRGALTWIPGGVPQVVGLDTEPPSIDIQAVLQVDSSGQDRFKLTITASKGGQQALRDRLGSLPEAGRQRYFERLVRRARPGVEGLVFSAVGLEQPDRPLKIALQGSHPTTLDAFGRGGIASIRPILAPALAASMQAGIAFEESTAIEPPTDLRSISARAPTDERQSDGRASMTIRREAQVIILDTHVEPISTASASEARSTREALRSRAQDSVELLLFGLPSSEIIASIRATEGRSVAERGVIEALLWWSVERDAKARKSLKRAAKAEGLGATLAQLKRYRIDAAEARWESLEQLARTDRERLSVARGLESVGRYEQAWRLAIPLSNRADDDVRSQAYLMRERIQERLPRVRDRSLEDERVEPEVLLALAEKTASDPTEAILRRAERLIRRGESATAEALLETTLRDTTDPRAEVLLAVTAAQSGLPRQEIVERIENARATKPFDLEVLMLAARGLELVNATGEALEYTSTAAHLISRDPALWTRTMNLAIARHDARAALYAAHRASDLLPDSVEHARHLQRLATWIGDRPRAARGAERAKRSLGRWPVPLSELRRTLSRSELLTVLIARREETEADPKLLRLRAELAAEAGMRELAARDGIRMARRFDIPAGHAFAFASNLGSIWSSEPTRELDTAVGNMSARLARMEYRLLTGGDALADARAIPSAPRARILLTAARDPLELAKQPERWKTPPRRHAAPPRFRPNGLLSALPGVSAWSDAVRGFTVVRVSPGDGKLPPPLSNLYTPVRPAERSLVGGGILERLEGGPLPLYVARIFDDEDEVFAIGFSARQAETALRVALSH